MLLVHLLKQALCSRGYGSEANCLNRRKIVRLDREVSITRKQQTRYSGGWGSAGMSLKKEEI